MNFQEYAAKAHPTSSFYRREGGIEHETMALFGLVGETGELVDLVKKHVFHDHPLDAAFRSKLVKEIGDVLWYIQESAHALGWDERERNDALSALQFASPKMITETTIPVWNGESTLLLYTRRLAVNVGKFSSLADESISARQWIHDEEERLSNNSARRSRLREILFYLSAVAARLGIQMEEAAAENIAKLWARYGGKFSSAASINRKE